MNPPWIHRKILHESSLKNHAPTDLRIGPSPNPETPPEAWAFRKRWVRKKMASHGGEISWVVNLVWWSLNCLRLWWLMMLIHTFFHYHGTLNGKCLHKELERSTMLFMGKLTISMAMASIDMLNYQRATKLTCNMTKEFMVHLVNK